LNPEEQNTSKYRRYQIWTGEALESQRIHASVIGLIVVDSIIVITDLAWVFLNRCNAGEEDLPEWLEILSHISLAINFLFFFEIPLAIWSFGWRFYSPVSNEYPHAGFHLFDAAIILGNLVIDLFLRGKAEELASLIVVFRLWRIVKVVGGVAVGVSEYNEEAVIEIKASRAEIHRLEARVTELEAENAALKKTSAIVY